MLPISGIVVTPLNGNQGTLPFVDIMEQLDDCMAYVPICRARSIMVSSAFVSMAN